ncbi:hypothetical protein [Chitinophaga sp. S165]|uniref:hypothetical protein n=1 Tax=Chitinophaga sp. S165 TaxID=2135462 RepID=UPI000D715DFC|nr:hypothetical protein [Chitinophaga sp. S165]PWV47046.1 hypothetical protein C7475_109133 [Chitinophaga sp. S165]
MKKIFLLAAVCLAGVKVSQAQHFSHGLGVGIFVEDAERAEPKGSYTLSYSPRFSFAETDKTSLSVGVPLNVGFSVTYYDGYSYAYSIYDDSDFGYTINIPVMLNFNIGAGSSSTCRDKMGYFIGAGYAYHVGSVYVPFLNEYGYEYNISETRSSTGLAANIGIRIGLGAKKKHNIEIRASYMKGITSYKPDVFGANCLFNF